MAIQSFRHWVEQTAQVPIAMQRERRLVDRVLHLWKEMVRGGLFPRRDQIEPSVLGEDWANCLVIAVQSPVSLSHFVEVGNNLSMMRCPNNSLAGVLFSHLPQVLSGGWRLKSEASLATIALRHLGQVRLDLMADDRCDYAPSAPAS
jgi:hypothetical protein